MTGSERCEEETGDVVAHQFELNELKLYMNWFKGFVFVQSQLKTQLRTPSVNTSFPSESLTSDK